MLKLPLPMTGVALVLAAFGFGLIPAAEAIPITGSAPVTSAAFSATQIAYVKKKVVVKKKGRRVTKTTVVSRHRPAVRVRAYGVATYHRTYVGCRTVVKYVISHNRRVKVVRRVC